jgi:hypothetical protein
MASRCMLSLRFAPAASGCLFGMPCGRVSVRLAGNCLHEGP